MMRGQWYEDVYSLSICHFVPVHPRKVEVCCVVVFIILIILRILGGLLSLWKKHWCVLRDDTFMWFRGKQVCQAEKVFISRNCSSTPLLLVLRDVHFCKPKMPLLVYTAFNWGV